MTKIGAVSDSSLPVKNRYSDLYRIRQKEKGFGPRSLTVQEHENL